MLDLAARRALWAVVWLLGLSVCASVPSWGQTTVYLRNLNSDVSGYMEAYTNAGSGTTWFSATTTTLGGTEIPLTAVARSSDRLAHSSVTGPRHPQRHCYLQHLRLRGGRQRQCQIDLSAIQIFGRGGVPHGVLPGYDGG